ncbi:hypothetical protein N9L83_00050 [Flavobacteriales bacterium]|jgi:hypothetical protein|nr:hypothetical protein [Flavobacteriales bacterium]
MMLRTILAVAGFVLAFTAQAQFSINATAYSTRCSGSPTGLVEIEAQGAVGEVSILTNIDLSSLEAGDYTISAEDGSGQQASVSFTILDHPATCGCTYPTAFNFDNVAEVDNGSCVFSSDQSCLADIVPDGIVGTNDLLQLLVEFGVVCSE